MPCFQQSPWYTILETNSSPLKIDGCKLEDNRFLVGWPIFRGENASFGEGAINPSVEMFQVCSCPSPILDRHIVHYTPALLSACDQQKVGGKLGWYLYVPGSTGSLWLGIVIHLPIGNPYYMAKKKPYYWVDDHPLFYGNTGSLDSGIYIYIIYVCIHIIIYIYIQYIYPPGNEKTYPTFQGKFGSNDRLKSVDQSSGISYFPGHYI